MDGLLDAAAAWFSAIGIPPMIGAFALGALASYLAFGRRDAAREVGGSGPISESSTTVLRSRTSVQYGGQTYALPPAVSALIDTGNKVEAIKALRAATGLQLKDAKAVVDALSSLRKEPA